MLKVLRACFQLSPDEWDDVIQVTFIDAFRHLSHLRDDRRFGAWVLVIARHEALLHAHGAASRSRRDAEYLAEADTLAASPASGEDELAYSVVREIVASMPDGPEKDTVTRFYFDGECSAAEVAEQLGVAKGTVTSRLTRFRARVKRRLAALLVRAEIAPERTARGPSDA